MEPSANPTSTSEEMNAVEESQQATAAVAPSTATVPVPASPPSAAAAPSVAAAPPPQPSATFRYEDVFPALPSSGSEPGPGAAIRQQNADKMRIGSSTQSKIICIPYAERREQEEFGECLPSNCANIMKETGTSIEIVTSKDQSLTFLIQGKPSNVKAAEKKIRQRFNPQRQVCIPQEFHKTIVGKSGNRLRELEKRTSTTIKIPKAGDNSDIITVTGAKEDVDRAVEELNSISEEAARQATDSIEVPKNDLPFVMGSVTMGSNNRIQELQESTKTYIHVSRDEPCRITISGDRQGVQSCKDKIQAILNEVKNYTTVSIQVPKNQHKYISGPRNQGVNEILADTGVYVEIPSNDAEGNGIVLRGPQDKVARALNLVYSKANSLIMKTVDAPTWKHRYVIGPKGSTIQKITQDYPKVNVDMKDKALDKIMIEGPTEEVTIVAKQVKSILDSLHCEEIKVKESYHKHIIGKNGSNVKRINEAYGVTISTFDSVNPRADAKNDATKKGIIRIEGKKDGVLKAKKEIQELVDKMDNEMEKSLPFDNRLYGHLIRANGERIKEIRDKYNQVQISIPKATDKSDVVKIRGAPKDVNECYKHLSKIADELRETSYCVEVPIYKPCHKLIIGKGGANIRKVREETQTKIDVPAENEESNLIKISGRKENVERAKEQILKIGAETIDLVTEDVTIPHEYHTSLIGPKGKGVRAITDDCGGVIIKFPPSGSNKNEVTVRGPKDDVQRAKQQLLSAAEECKLSSYTAEVRVDPQYHRFLQRRSGNGIKRIAEQTRTRISMPTDRDDDRDMITIMGREENVKLAKADLEALVQEVANIVVDTLEVDPKHHKHFIFRRGDVVNRISDECGGVKISFPQAGSTVTLEGTRDNVDAAIKRIKDTVDERESEVTIDCVVPHFKHRCMVGSGGTKVQAIQNEFNVHIKFPDKNRDASEDVNGEQEGEDGAARVCDTIHITGREENCLAAKEALLARVPVEVEIEVPCEYHRLIIQDRRELQKQLDVGINLPPVELKSELIKVNGCPSSIEELKKIINERIEEYKLNSFEVKFEVDTQYLPKIIGSKGSVINKIRNDHNVRIMLPPRDAEDNTITIVGLEKNAVAARDEILSIVDKLVNMVREEVQIDSRVHARLIGRRAININKVMDKFNVDISVPRRGEPNPDLVTIVGSNVDDVLNAKEHLLNLAEEYMQEILDDEAPPPRISSFASVFANAAGDSREQNSESSSAAGGAAGGVGSGGSGSGSGNSGGVADDRKNGFVVTGAPWEQKAPDMQSKEDFPSFGASASATTTSSWGPSSQKWGVSVDTMCPINLPQ